MPPPEPKPIPPHTIRAHIVPGIEIDIDSHIRPAKIKRDWMDTIPQQYIYRCIPLLAANTMGWEILNPSRSELIWAGGDLTTDLKIKTDTPGKFSAASHFGSGIVTWYVPFLFKTSPDLGLLVCGPANHEHNDSTPLEAFIRTDWLPFPFTMNWRLTVKDKKVIFEQGEVIARIIPFPIALLEETRLEIANLSDDPGFLAEVNQFGQARQANIARQQANMQKAIKNDESLNPDTFSGEGVWNSQYVRAKGRTHDSRDTLGKDLNETSPDHEKPDQKKDGFLPHQTIFKCAPPIDIRHDGDDTTPKDIPIKNKD